MKRSQIIKWLRDREYAFDTYHNTACSIADIARHLHCSPTKVDGMLDGRVPKAVEKYLGLLNRGGNFQIVSVPVKVPTGDFCCDGQTQCEHLQAQYITPECPLVSLVDSPKSFVLGVDGDGRVRKPEMCRNFKIAGEVNE